MAANLGIDGAALRRVNPRSVTLGLPAFPAGPQRNWVSYGTGVHAIAGLGDVTACHPDAEGSGRPVFAAPAVTYPDPLAGLGGAALALSLLHRRDAGAPPGAGRKHAGSAAGAGGRPDPARLGGCGEVPLASAVSALAALAALADRGSLVRPLPPSLAPRLAERYGPVPPPPFHPANARDRPPPTGRGEDGQRGR